VVGPQFSDLFWPVACGLWEFFLKAAGGTRVQEVILSPIFKRERIFLKSKITVKLLFLARRD
jgi:hypothetical protein